MLIYVNQMNNIAKDEYSFSLREKKNEAKKSENKKIKILGGEVALLSFLSPSSILHLSSSSSSPPRNTTGHLRFCKKSLLKACPMSDHNRHSPLTMTFDHNI
jgi:hypothetical protein